MTCTSARIRAVVAASAVALGVAAPAVAAPAADQTRPPHARHFDTRSVDGFVGSDGVTYAPAPLTVPGLGDELFYGPDFDVACGIGKGMATALRRVAKLARVIERSGREVVWTVAPSKTTVLPHLLPDALPHGACDRAGLADVRRVLARQRDRNFLPLLEQLSRSRHQAYFKTDPHWSTVGGSIYARTLARRLDPRVGKRQHYRYGTETRLGLLNWFRGVSDLETAETAAPRGGVKTRTARRSAEQWTGYPALTSNYSWTSKPRRGAVPGRTLLVGDSFTMFALDSLLPVFSNGQWIWIGEVPERTLIRAIKRADRVVLEVAEVFAPLGAALTKPGLRRAVSRALR